MHASSPDQTQQNTPEFMRRQYEFAAHIRDPDHQARPAMVEDRRMAIYRDLFYNNIEGFVASGFPVLRSITPDERWHAMVRDFMVQHHCHSPYFSEVSQEFIAYLQNTRNNPSDPPFMIELAHYEWVELALDIAEEELHEVAADSMGNLLTGVPAASPLAWPLAYQWPVNSIGPDLQPTETPTRPTYMIVYRDVDDEIHFMETSYASYRLLELCLEEGSLTGQAMLEQVSTELGMPLEQLLEPGKVALEELRERGLILGTS